MAVSLTGPRKVSSIKLAGFGSDNLPPQLGQVQFSLHIFSRSKLSAPLVQRRNLRREVSSTTANRKKRISVLTSGKFGANFFPSFHCLPSFELPSSEVPGLSLFAFRLCHHLLFRVPLDNLVGAKWRRISAAGERIGKTGDMTARFPDFGMHRDGRIQVPPCRLRRCTLSRHHRRLTLFFNSTPAVHSPTQNQVRRKFRSIEK